MAAGVADNDVAWAVVEKWRATAAITQRVPGGLQRGRLSSFQPDAEPKVARKLPYAGFEVTQGPSPNQHHAGTPDVIDYRRADIDIRGIKADVVNALQEVRTAFVRQPLSVPNTVAFMGCVEIDSSLREDPATRAAEDIWIGTISLSVVTHRRQP